MQRCHRRDKEQPPAIATTTIDPERFVLLDPRIGKMQFSTVRADPPAIAGAAVANDACFHSEYDGAVTEDPGARTFLVTGLAVDDREVLEGHRRAAAEDDATTALLGVEHAGVSAGGAADRQTPIRNQDIAIATPRVNPFRQNDDIAIARAIHRRLQRGIVIRHAQPFIFETVRD